MNSEYKKQLLELAAKAADKEGIKDWDPLYWCFDALELAAKLRMSIILDKDLYTVYTDTAVGFARIGDNAQQALRLAITRTAAEVELAKKNKKFELDPSP